MTGMISRTRHIILCSRVELERCACPLEVMAVGRQLTGAWLQSDDGKWNKFGGRLAWDKSAICCNNPAFGGTGSAKTGEDYVAAPNIDHTQARHVQGFMSQDVLR